MAETEGAASLALIGAEWTKDGEFFGNIPIPRGANDVHIEIEEGRQRPEVQFTRNGEPIGEPIVPPPAANDVGFSWPGGRGIPILIFTRNRRALWPPFVPPPDVNDLHVAWRGGLITGAEWTIDKNPVAPPIPVPGGANDAHFYLLDR